MSGNEDSKNTDTNNILNYLHTHVFHFSTKMARTLFRFQLNLHKFHDLAGFLIRSQSEMNNKNKELNSISIKVVNLLS